MYIHKSRFGSDSLAKFLCQLWIPGAGNRGPRRVGDAGACGDGIVDVCRFVGGDCSGDAKPHSFRGLIAAVNNEMYHLIYGKLIIAFSIMSATVIFSNDFSSRRLRSFSYRLAPEHKYPAAVDDCFEAYRIILEKNPGKAIFLIGESGGAYLSIVTAMKARDHKVQMPAGVIPYSPVTDFSGDLDRDRESVHDFTVTQDALVNFLAKLYCAEEEKRNPYVSPYFDDMHGMPPMLLAWDESETLAIDSEIIVAKLEKQGIECRWKSYPDCFHAFATTGRGTPESMEILQDTKKFMEERIAAVKR